MMNSYSKVFEVCDFIRGITFTPKDLVSPRTDGAIACLRTKNVQEEIDLSDVIYVPKSFVKSENQILANGDILISNANSKDIVGKCCYIANLEFPATLGGFITAARAKREKILPRYLYYWMSFPVTQARFRSLARQTTNIANLPMSLVGSLEIPLPPLAEQERIVCLLDEADILRKLRTQASVRMEEFVPALFYEMFGDPITNEKGWTTVSFVEVTEGKYGIKAGPFGSSIKKETYKPSGYKVYGQEQVIADDFTIGDYYIDEDKFQELRACEVKSGDVLISLVGTFGKISVVPQGIQPGIINPRLLKITPNQALVIPLFLKVLLENNSIQNQLEHYASGGTMGVLNAGILKKLSFALPPLTLQQEFAERLQAAREIQSRQVQSAERIKAFYQSMLSRAFAGEL
jgi:type I restriction enzyme S subunit